MAAGCQDDTIAIIAPGGGLLHGNRESADLVATGSFSQRIQRNAASMTRAQESVRVALHDTHDMVWGVVRENRPDS